MKDRIINAVKDNLGYMEEVSQNQDNHVRTFKIKGRKIVAPDKRYKKLLRLIRQLNILTGLFGGYLYIDSSDKEILRYTKPTYNSHIKIVKNLSKSYRFHESIYIMEIDLKSAYDNIPSRLIENVLTGHPKDTTGKPCIIAHVAKAIGIPPDELSKLILDLCLYKNGLPQGFPTSPDLAEAIYWNYLDKPIRKYCSRARNSLRYRENCSGGSNYFRWADNLFFTFWLNKPQVEFRETRRWLFPFLSNYIESTGFPVNKSKTKVFWKGKTSKVGSIMGLRVDTGKLSRRQEKILQYRALSADIKKNPGTARGIRQYLRIT